MASFDEELAFLEDSTSLATHEDETGLLQHQLVTSPLLTFSVLQDRSADFPSRGLLGINAGERIYFNTNAPNSAVICGVQGSGKSHTVSCLLECGLIADACIGQLPNPLSALVFHFDTQDLGRPCEAAFLSVPSAYGVNQTSLPRITVLCSPSNVERRRRAYSALPHVRVYSLQLSERDLTADRMLVIMGCNNLETVPLYLHTVLRIVREIGADRFSYLEFKRRLAEEPLDFKQRSMLKLRLDLLDCFIRPGAPQTQAYFRVGGLVLIDLTDPFLDGLTAAVLFDSVLGSFIQWQTACGKLVVLDEAHKYLVNSDTDRLARSVSDIIRLQRHLATRVIIATQEPTVIPATILDLASMIICHRFSSPAWCAHLSKHVSMGKESAHWFEEVMQLATGHAIVFSPSALIKVGESGQGATLLGREYLKVRVRPRLTLDGGASHLAVQSDTNSVLKGYQPEQRDCVPDGPVSPVLDRPMSPVVNRPVSPLAAPSAFHTGAPAGATLPLSTPLPVGADIPMSAPSASQDPSRPSTYIPLFEVGPASSAPFRPVESVPPQGATPLPEMTPVGANVFIAAPSTSQEPPRPRGYITLSEAGPASSAPFHTATSTPLCHWAVDTIPSLPGPSHASPNPAASAFFPEQSETFRLITAPSAPSAPRTILTRSMTMKSALPQGPSTSTTAYQPSFIFNPSPAPPMARTPPAPLSEATLGTVTPPTGVWPIASRFRHLVNYLIRHGADRKAVKLNLAKSSIFGVVRMEYPGVPKKKWWDKMLQEAVDAHLILLINMELGKKHPDGKMVQLIARGQFVYV